MCICTCVLHVMTLACFKDLAIGIKLVLSYVYFLLFWPLVTIGRYRLNFYLTCCTGRSEQESVITMRRSSATPRVVCLLFLSGAEMFEVN